MASPIFRTLHSRKTSNFKKMTKLFRTPFTQITFRRQNYKHCKNCKHRCGRAKPVLIFISCPTAFRKVQEDDTHNFVPKIRQLRVVLASPLHTPVQKNYFEPRKLASMFRQYIENQLFVLVVTLRREKVRAVKQKDSCIYIKSVEWNHLHY